MIGSVTISSPIPLSVEVIEGDVVCIDGRGVGTVVPEGIGVIEGVEVGPTVPINLKLYLPTGSTRLYFPKGRTKGWPEKVETKTG